MAAMSVTKLELSTALGPVFRDVLTTPPRDCTPEEIPIIDISPVFSEHVADRKRVAAEIRSSALNMGFFYVKNHGIPEDIIRKCREQVLKFFKQDEEKKNLVSKKYSKFYNGYSARRSTHVNPTESLDHRESFMFRYEANLEGKDPAAVPAEVQKYIRGEHFLWDGTAHLLHFKDDVIAYWLACLRLARRLVRIFALSLDLPEDYWDDKVTYPGADGVFNYYPPQTREEARDNAVNLGSHTDLQLFTLLCQDQVAGLQVLNPQGQWIKAPPVAGTLVVNIGDFMMRLSNDIYNSTVHRVRNESLEERVTMPFFFGERPNFSQTRRIS